LLTIIACDPCTARDAASAASGQPAGYGAGTVVRATAGAPAGAAAGAGFAPGAWHPAANAASAIRNGAGRQQILDINVSLSHGKANVVERFVVAERRQTGDRQATQPAQ
jgi:hypothetical protein